MLILFTVFVKIGSKRKNSVLFKTFTLGNATQERSPMARSVKMKKRNTAIYVMNEIPYLPGAPVVVKAGRLTKDPVSGKLRCQLELASLSEEPISEVTVRLSLFNAEGKAVGSAQKERFQNLSVRKDGTIKGKTEVVLSDKDVYSFTAETEEVRFADGGSWRAEEKAEWMYYPRVQTLEEAYGDEQVAEQFRIRFGEDCRYLPWSEDALWFCTCGAVNRPEENRCRQCRRVRKALMRVTADELRKEAGKRKQREEQGEEDTSEADGGGEKKRWIPAAVAAGVFLALIVAMLVILPGRLKEKDTQPTEAPAEVTAEPEESPEPSSEPSEEEKSYQEAMLLLQKADLNDASALSLIGRSEEEVPEDATAAMLLYQAALEGFEGLKGYQDSKECAERCREGIEKQKQVLLQQAYDWAAELLEEKYYSRAQREFQALGEFEDSRDMVKEAAYRKAVELSNAIQSYNVHGVYAEISMDPDVSSRFVLVGEFAPGPDSDCAEAIRAACGNDPIELSQADSPEEGMQTMEESVMGLFKSLAGYHDSDSHVLVIQDAADHSKDFYRLCADGDLAAAQGWLNAWGDEIKDRAVWQERLDHFLPYCGEWKVYSGDMSIIPYMAGREGFCYGFSTHVSIGEEENAVLHMVALDGEEEYGIDFSYLEDNDFFYNSDYEPFNFLMVINNTGRMSCLMYRTDSGALLTSCEYTKD